MDEELLKLIRKKDSDGIILYENEMCYKQHSWDKIDKYIKILKCIIEFDELKNDYDLFIYFFWESKYSAIRKNIELYRISDYNIDYIAERMKILYNSLYEKKLYKQMNYVYDKVIIIFKDYDIKVHDPDLDERVSYVIDRFGMKTEFIRLFI